MTNRTEPTDPASPTARSRSRGCPVQSIRPPAARPASTRRTRLLTLAIHQEEIDMLLQPIGLTTSPVLGSPLTAAPGTIERRGRRHIGLTSPHWLADAAHLSTAWAHGIAHHHSDRPAKISRRPARPEGLYMETARMAREMDRL
jgi:hypothetical protein